MDRDFLIVSLYGPNRDDPEFYAELEERINDVGFENVIIGGDWNLVLDYTLDYYNHKHHNNIKAQEQVNNLMINLDLLDIWRIFIPKWEDTHGVEIHLFSKVDSIFSWFQTNWMVSLPAADWRIDYVIDSKC